MYNKTFKSLLAATVASTVMIGAAHAGGFARTDADTQIIYEEGNFNIRTSVTIVSPSRKYTKADYNPSLIGEDSAPTYVSPSVALKANISDDLRCAATMTNNLGGSQEQSSGVIGGFGTYKSDLVTYEYGATCGYKFDLSKGRLWILGGAFVETIDVLKAATAPGLGKLSLDLGGEDYGFRVGAAYEIPEIALRTELMYRSGTSYGADGAYYTALGKLPTTATGDLPQSVELNVQSGVAPGWLAFGSVKWTDWSVTKTFDVAPVGPIGVSVDSFNWRDGWTVTGGVGHQFTDRVSGLAAITWDRGVGTGYDLMAETWTLSLGASVKDNWGGELRGGVGLSRLGSAKSYLADPREGLPDMTAVGTDYAIAGNIGYAIKW